MEITYKMTESLNNEYNNLYMNSNIVGEEGLSGNRQGIQHLIEETATDQVPNSLAAYLVRAGVESALQSLTRSILSGLEFKQILIDCGAQYILSQQAQKQRTTIDSETKIEKHNSHVVVAKDRELDFTQEFVFVSADQVHRAMVRDGVKRIPATLRDALSQRITIHAHNAQMGV